MLDWDDYFAYCKICRDNDLKLLSVCNGTMIFSPLRAARVVDCGPAEVSVSLDSSRYEVHDRLRGVRGSFDRATRALQLLLAARRASGSGIKIHAILLVGKSTYEELDEAYDFALNKLGVDKLKLNMIQPSFGRRAGEDAYFAEESQVDANKLEEILWRVCAKYDLAFNPGWVAQVLMYFRSFQGNPNVLNGWSGDLTTSEHICNSYDRNIWISDRSVMQLCCDEKWAGREWTAPGDLRKFWEEAQPQRDAMGTCNSLCGISHSLRNLSSTTRATKHGQ
jgi:MoaA/NifB/PqqE/SkfB family radical SAM enzyme